MKLPNIDKAINKGLSKKKMGSCPRSYSYEHAYVPHGTDKIKCVLCGYIKNRSYAI